MGLPVQKPIYIGVYKFEFLPVVGEVQLIYDFKNNMETILDVVFEV